MEPVASTSLLQPIPLAARASIGRGVAAVIGALALVGGVFAVTADPGSVPLSTPALVAMVAPYVVLCAVVATAPWRTWLPRSGQDLLLAALVAIPALSCMLTYALSDGGDMTALLALHAIAAASALMIPALWHLAGSGVVVSVLVVLAALHGELGEIGLVLVTVSAVVLLTAQAAAILGAALRTSVDREVEAEAANRALMAVVDGARTSAAADVQEVLDAVVNATGRIQSDMAGVYLLRPDGRFEYGARYQVPEELRSSDFASDEGIAGQALQEDRLVVTNDYQTHDWGFAGYREAGLQAAIGAPIRTDSGTVGVLSAGRFSSGGYDDAAKAAFELLANHAGRALTLAHAIDEDRQLLKRLRSLRALQEDFVATISHELRTPLTVIDGLAQTLEARGDQLDEADTAALLSRLRANTTSLKTIVTSLLQAARLDRGLVEVEARAIDLGDLVEGCVARLWPVLADHEIQVDVADVQVRADGDLLERVVDNLLTNAQRHTPAGTTVRVEARLAGGICTVAISDDGPGIAESDLAVITERFTRGGDLDTRTTRGLGLGLALSDQVLRLHGSRLQVTSPSSGGARFAFQLDVATEAG